MKRIFMAQSFQSLTYNVCSLISVIVAFGLTPDIKAFLSEFVERVGVGRRCCRLFPLWFSFQHFSLLLSALV